MISQVGIARTLNNSLSKPSSPKAAHHLFCSNFTGTRHNLSYNQLAQRNPHIPPAALRGGLAQLLQLTRQQGTTPASRGLTSILDLGVQNVLASQTSVPRPIPPSWTLPPASFRSNGQGLQLSKLAMLRELGMAEGRQGVSLAPAGYARQIKHHRTVRGHQDVAYCVMVDKRGEYIITGSDDKIVKVRDSIFTFDVHGIWTK